jgi:hypothetical integral membrane protein (TIGR02206 family)
MPQPFEPFSQQHLIAVLIGTVATAALIMAGRRGGQSRCFASMILAFLNLSAYPLGQAAWLALDAPKSVDNLLPFHLCDIAAITAGFALITRRPLLCALTYFWGLAATLQALITPAIHVAFPHPPFVMFFVQHFAVVATALYLPLANDWRPQGPFWRTPLQVFGLSIIYLMFAAGVNQLLGSNFAFATRPPDNPSLIDHLGPWPWYLGSLLGIALVFFFLLNLPFLKTQRTRSEPSQ